MGLQQIAATPTLISIALGAGLVLVQQWNGGLSPLVQMTFFGVLLGLTGIPHGALDHLVEQETARKAQRPFHLYPFLGQYLLTMAGYGALWLVFPSGSLLFFLLMSAWHFGETDLEKAPPTWPWNLARFILGTLVLSGILLLHRAETAPLVARISGGNAAVLATWDFLATHATAVLVTLALTFAALFAIAYQQRPLLLDRGRVLRWCCILLLTAYLPLLPAFALYFGGWHALNTFGAIGQYLSDEHPAAGRITVGYGLKIWAQTALFTGIALLFLGLGGWYWYRFWPHLDPLPLVFVFLSLITLPHLNVMRKMNRG
jgi:beta-carotene 15,15'-dioxygenase